MIEKYLKSLLDIVAASPLVRSSSLTLDRRTLHSGLIRGELNFVDGSCLYFRELVAVQARVIKKMYSYHYQRVDASLVFRYDDTPHFTDLLNFPHHKHVGSESNVLSAKPPDLAGVLHEIEAGYVVIPDAS